MQEPFRESPSAPIKGMACVSCGMAVGAEANECPECGSPRPAGGWPPFRQLASPPRRLIDRTELPAGLTATGAPPPARIYVGGGDAPEGVEQSALRLDLADLESQVIEAEDIDARQLGPGSMYAGRYRIEEELGREEGAHRHSAIQEPLVRRVVLTVLLPDLAPDEQESLEERFLHEGSALARVRHPCLAPVHDAGRAGDRTCYLTEELLYGSTLQELAASGPLQPERALDVAADLTSALVAAHEVGVPHRCLRADRVILTTWGWRGRGREVAQIGRFALEVVPERVATELDPESLLAWPPEVLAGHEPGKAADLYAVGALLYRALSGHAPYLGSPEEIRAAALAGPPPALEAPGDGRLGDGLCAVANRCLRSKPEERYPTARALLTELERLAARPAPAPPVPAPVVIQAPPSRMPALRILVAAGLAGAVVPTLALAIMARQAELHGPGQWFAPQPRPAVAMIEPLAAPEEAAPPPSAPLDEQAEVEEVAPEEEAPAPTPPEQPTIVKPVAAPPAPVAAPVAARPTAQPSPASPDLASAQEAPSTARAAAAPEPAAVSTPSPVAERPPEKTATAPARAALGPTVPGAPELSGLWVGRAGRDPLALDLTVSADGRVTGRMRREGAAKEAAVSGRVSGGEDGLLVELQVTEAGITTTYSGVVEDAELRGRIYSGGKAQGRFVAQR